MAALLEIIVRLAGKTKFCYTSSNNENRVRPLTRFQEHSYTTSTFYGQAKELNWQIDQPKSLWTLFLKLRACQTQFCQNQIQNLHEASRSVFLKCVRISYKDRQAIYYLPTNGNYQERVIKRTLKYYLKCSAVSIQNDKDEVVSIAELSYNYSKTD